MFYVYEHIRKDTNIPFYVGRAKAIVLTQRRTATFIGSVSLKRLVTP